MANEISDFESKITSLRGLVANQRKINESLELKLQVRTDKKCACDGPITKVAVQLQCIGLQCQNLTIIIISGRHFRIMFI